VFPFSLHRGHTSSSTGVERFYILTAWSMQVVMRVGRQQSDVSMALSVGFPASGYSDFLEVSLLVLSQGTTYRPGHVVSCDAYFSTACLRAGISCKPQSMPSVP
jgi:hypothetical protein